MKNEDSHMNHHHHTEEHMKIAGPEAHVHKGHGEKKEKDLHLSHKSDSHEHRDRHFGHNVEDFKRRFWISTLLTIPVLLLSPMIQHFLGFHEFTFSGSNLLLFFISSFIFFYGGYPFLKGLYDEIKYQRQPGMMTLIAIAITVAYIYSTLIVFGLSGMSFFWELATLIDIMLLGHWIEMRSVLGASRALEELVKLLPSEAHIIIRENETKDIPIQDLIAGNKVLIKPGEKIPADGKVLSGNSSVNESMLTGESNPIKKFESENVIAGSINGQGQLTVEITKTGKDTYLSQVIELVTKAQESRSKTQDLANRAALYLTIAALTGGTVTLLVWLLLGQSFAFSLERTVTVMVIACPHALGLAVPLVIAMSTTISAKKGFLVRNRIAFEKVKNTNVVVFDKTGTLTEGKFGVTDVISFDGKKNDLIAWAAALEMNSEHPIAQGILQHAKNLNIKMPSINEFNSIPGKGVEGKLNGEIIKVVSPGYLKENNLSIDARADNLSKQGKTVVFVLRKDNVIGAIALGDIIRKESKRAVKNLKKIGIRTIVLTGDNSNAAKWISDEIGADEYFAEVLPHVKSEKIKEVQSKGFVVTMVGDGVNDAPALVQADVGIAIGAGTDVAVEAADIVLVKNNPKDVVEVIKLAKATYKKMVQNLFWATGYNAVTIPLAAGVLYSYGILLSPALGAVLMSLSTIIVAINARTLKVN